ncbi:hypothetical protein DM860_005135 [Cuscuta australis]|uniref:LOB domain-containing protein n=1 Tax=Cuscuta australis TaxID=267555 RepID=A0A328DN08_9ASTE|nr:hypothetical protein DM860_005135 [Cuscuta australis]
MTIKGAGGGGGGGSPACAACKHQRRKCHSDCMLAPYFPATDPRTFINAHRLFGIRNIVKTLRKIDDDDKKDDAMKALIFEADMRQKFPVHGCVQYIAHLSRRLQEAEDELARVRAQLASFRCRQRMLTGQHGGGFVGDGDDDDNTSYDICGSRDGPTIIMPRQFEPEEAYVDDSSRYIPLGFHETSIPD